MDVGEPASEDARTTVREETFCRYLAKQLIAKRGFVPGAVPEAGEIAAQSDVILTYIDGYSPIIVALIDREAHPDKAFTLSPARVREIAKACQAYAGRVNGVRMPVSIQLMEVGPATPDQPSRL